jgi:hypothetical protein
MSSGNSKNTNKISGGFPKAMRDSERVSGGAPTQKRERSGNAFAGFVLLVILHTVLIWLAVRVGESAGIVSWSVGWWGSLKLATLYCVWRSVSVVSWERAKRQS